MQWLPVVFLEDVSELSDKVTNRDEDKETERTGKTRRLEHRSALSQQTFEVVENRWRWAVASPFNPC